MNGLWHKQKAFSKPSHMYMVCLPLYPKLDPKFFDNIPLKSYKYRSACMLLTDGAHCICARQCLAAIMMQKNYSEF